MSPPSEYTKTLHNIAIKQVVADLGKEKVGRQGPVSTRVRWHLYEVKTMTLAAMGIPISYNALTQRVNRKLKKSHGHLSGKEFIVDQNTDDLSGFIPVTGVSEGTPTPTNAGRPKGSTDDKKR